LQLQAQSGRRHGYRRDRGRSGSNRHRRLGGLRNAFSDDPNASSGNGPLALPLGVVLGGLALEAGGIAVVVLNARRFTDLPPAGRSCGSGSDPTAAIRAACGTLDLSARAARQDDDGERAQSATRHFRTV
jgi:hypothetical protein